MSPPLDRVLAHLDDDFDAAVGRLDAFLRIPSVGTDPAHAADTRAAAQWLSDQLSGIGFDASVRDTPGQPMVVGHHPGPGGDVPHILYYGHYDVQPADPLELWESPPFEPTVVASPYGKQIVARGAVDDKGQVMTWLEATHPADYDLLYVKPSADGVWAPNWAEPIAAAEIMRERGPEFRSEN